MIFKGTDTSPEKCSKICEIGAKADGWLIWNTPLKKYTYMPGQNMPMCGRPDFRDLLEEKKTIMRAYGEVLRALDLGIGSGAQWLEDLRDDGISLSGTTLNAKNIHPELNREIIVCDAGSLHKHFPKSSFHVVVSHYGSHLQEIEALWNGLHVLKVGGEMVMSGDNGMDLDAPLITRYVQKAEPAPFCIKSIDESPQGRKVVHWFYHIIKTEDYSIKN